MATQSDDDDEEYREIAKKLEEEGEEILENLLVDTIKCPVKVMKYDVLADSNATRCKAENLCDRENNNYWMSTKPKATVLIQLPAVSLLSVLKIHNRSTSYITISISEKNEKRLFVEMKTNMLIPHNRMVNIPMAHVPCKYIKIECHKGAPISFNSIVCGGIQNNFIRTYLGNHYLSLMYSNPFDIFYGSSRKYVLPKVVQPKKINMDSEVAQKFRAEKDELDFLDYVSLNNSTEYKKRIEPPPFGAYEENSPKMIENQQDQKGIEDDGLELELEMELEGEEL